MVIRYHDNMDDTNERIETSAGFKAAFEQAKKGASEGGV